MLNIRALMNQVAGERSYFTFSLGNAILPSTDMDVTLICDRDILRFEDKYCILLLLSYLVFIDVD